MHSVITPRNRRFVVLLLVLATVVVTALVAAQQFRSHARMVADERAYEVREVQQSLSSLHRDLAMVSILIAGNDDPLAGPVAEYLWARRSELSAVRWLAYVPAPGEAPRTLLGSAVMAAFDHRQDSGVTALLDQLTGSNPAAGVPTTYRNLTSLALALPAPPVSSGKRPALVALVDVNSLLHDTLRDASHLPLAFDFLLGETMLSQWPPFNHAEVNQKHSTIPFSVGAVRYALAFEETAWLDLPGSQWLLPLAVVLAGMVMVEAWLLSSRWRPRTTASPIAPPAPPAAPDLRAARVGRLWQLGEMTAALGHDLGQPLNIIRLTAEAALDSLDHNGTGPDRIRRSLNTAVDQAQRVQGMIDALLAVTRRPAFPPEQIQPVAAVRQALSVTMPRLRANSVRLLWHADLETPAVTGHARRLEQAIANLLVNAADALAAGGLAEGTDEPGVLRVSCHGDHGEATIVVEDNGPGLSAAIRDSLENPFPKLAAAGKGPGIGLTVALGIIAEMGGSITFRNMSPGTRVTIRLPAAATRRRSVLVVDDEAEAAREISDYLAKRGWQVRVASGGNEALRLFEQGPCDAVITDLHMAEGDGWRLIENLHACAPDLAIIAITTAQGDEARRAVAAGAVMVLHKPVGLEQISQELDDLIAGDN